MQQHGSKYFACGHPGPWGWGQKVKIELFQSMVMLHINLKGITKCSSMVANILSADPYPTTPPRPWGLESLGQSSTFSEHGHVIYQIKDNHKCSNMVANILLAVIPHPGDGVNRLRFNFFSEYGHGAYKIKENHEYSNMVENILPAYPLPRTLGMAQ